MSKVSKHIPFIGVVSNDGYVESYDYETAEKFDFHHSLALSERGCKVYEKNDTLRFVMYKGTNTYTLEGEAALDPFNEGFKQVQLFVNHVLQNGANPNIEIEVAQHYLNTEWEGRRIGKLKDWVEGI